MAAANGLAPAETLSSGEGRRAARLDPLLTCGEPGVELAQDGVETRGPNLECRHSGVPLEGVPERNHGLEFEIGGERAHRSIGFLDEPPEEQQP